MEGRVARRGRTVVRRVVNCMVSEFGVDWLFGESEKGLKFEELNLIIFFFKLKFDRKN